MKIEVKNLLNYSKSDIKDYIVSQRKICKQLKHWKYLTDQEKKIFEAADKEFTVDNLMTTARKRAYDNQLRNM